LVELCEEKLPTYFINSEDKLLSKDSIIHYDFHTGQQLTTRNYLPEKEKVSILITSGASCPDAVVEAVIKKLAGFYPASRPFDEIIYLYS
jgi:4-hydroxy-3-methylbut-2-enyl diphosphate reductase